jgi:uncharacterized protein YecE (DUF72 family)
MGNILVGTSGYTYDSWKGRFYPEDLPKAQWMHYYTQHFKTLEINATFYRFFSKEIYQKWYDKTPDDFVFVIKGPKLITHQKKLVDIEGALKDFIDQCSGLQHKLGCILWQFAASFTATPQNCQKLTSFFEKLPKDCKFVIELRDTSWFTSDSLKLLKQYHIGFVINDTPAFDVTEKVTSDIIYIRFHGPQALYASSYSEETLREWSQKIIQWKNDHDVFCFFNNDMSGYAIQNAQVLKRLMGILPTGQSTLFE